eukprot:CAMPEP_0175093286 /NCGR_PEP_ID=MMETSP0086_2-20121207/2926_1 /TAXON_ID=136419 /ORGANISM="Unknown Unknown, Strain D1" /LENGTH=159 /DNA_ID=CAMNT_0016366227 /DNA_START=37 /DNA_END=513 /DNA_ORIENTATION=+
MSTEALLTVSRVTRAGLEALNRQVADLSLLGNHLGEKYNVVIDKFSTFLKKCKRFGDERIHVTDYWNQRVQDEKKEFSADEHRKLHRDMEFVLNEVEIRDIVDECKSISDSCAKLMAELKSKMARSILKKKVCIVLGVIAGLAVVAGAAIATMIVLPTG